MAHRGGGGGGAAVQNRFSSKGPNPPPLSFTPRYFFFFLNLQPGGPAKEDELRLFWNTKTNKSDVAAATV